MISIARGPIARGTIRTSLVLGLRLVVQAGTLLLVARMLGPHDYGAFAGVAALALMLGTLATFGTNVILLSQVAREPALRKNVLLYAVPLTLLCGGVLLVVYLLICVFVIRATGVTVAVLIAIGAAETLLQPLFSLPATEHLALGRIARSQLLTILPLTLRLAAAAAVFLLRPSDPLASYGFGYFLASLLALGVATLTMPAPWPDPRVWRLPTRAELRAAAGYATINLTATTPAELDKTLATGLLPLAVSGVYAAGARVVGALTLPVIAMILSALPRLFREGQGKPGNMARLLRWIFAAALGYSLALGVVLWFIAPIFVWLFGAKYQGVVHAIHWLTLAVPGMALRMVAGSTLMAMAHPWLRVGFEVAGLMVLLVFSVLLAPRWGLTGMALALVIMEWAMAVIGIGWVVHFGRNPPLVSTAP